MKHLFAATLLALAMLSRVAIAGNVAPLGMELGVATVAQVQKDIGSRTSLRDRGINKYSGGRMLTADGAGLEVEGLTEITFIFDKTDKLAGVLMTLPKGGMNNENFKRTMDMLAAKYKIVQKRVPFVGNSYAKYRQGDSVVELDAPHLSFTMSLRYLTNRLVSDFTSQSTAEQSENRRKQASQL